MPKRAQLIVETLSRSGYIAYYAGGYVRDFLLNLESDDVDIATSAPPKIIQKLFLHTVPIGLAFGIILVIIDGHSYEVATFRKDLAYQDGRRPEKVAFTSEREDALRRDFTINGMFFDPLKEKLIDYVGGQKDLKAGLIRAIGNPKERFQEDRLRMIRAVRLSNRFNFKIEAKTKAAILKQAHTLFPSVAIERVFQELNKMAKEVNFKRGLFLLFELKLLTTIFPALKKITKKELEKRLFETELIPHLAPTIAKILPIFGPLALEEKISCCQYLKLSQEDFKYVAFADLLEKKLQKASLSASELVDLYAQKNFQIALEALAIRYPLAERKIFLARHFQNQQKLKNFIERKKNGRPLIRAEDLKNLGIQPSPLMGKLLKEAETIAIEQNLEDKEKVLFFLKQSSFWPKLP
ncbi:MAG: CCA tRNA nucleotidyltransferase [Parachlamydiales bacterium]|jgi:poly(A) polymerase